LSVKQTLTGRKITLIVGGGIAAVKVPDLIRRMRERGADIVCVLTASGAEFVTPLALSALSENKVYTDLFDLTDEAEMGHIQLSRRADLIVVAPATANLMARMAAGMADDLATTLLLATDAPVMVAPAMNVRMFEHPATQRNLQQLQADGVKIVGPDEGAMACGEFGPGRMTEPLDIIAAIEDHFGGEPAGHPLSGRHVLVTSGPTHEPIDPVRYIANRSSGKQGHAIAAALAGAGARVTLVSGPVNLPDPQNVDVKPVESARDMLAECRAALPADVVICAAAVADWRVAQQADEKLKKASGELPTLSFAENPDILATLSTLDSDRPELVIGFAAETEKVVEFATAKRARKGCDWILANDVSPASGTFGGDDNTVTQITVDGATTWPRGSKAEVADRLAREIVSYFDGRAAE